MGLLDRIKGLAGQHADKVEGAIDKVAEVVDDKTGGKYADKIDQGVEAAKDFVGDGEGEGGAEPAVDGDGENVIIGDQPNPPTSGFTP